MENLPKQLALSSLSGCLGPQLRLNWAISEFAEALDEGRKNEFRRIQNASSNQLLGIDVIRLTEEINKDGECRHSAWRPYGTRVHSFLSRLQMFAAIGDVMIGGSQNLIATGVWSAVRLALMAATNYLGYFEKLSAIFMKLGTSWTLHKDYARLFGSSEVLQNHLCEYLILLMKLCRNVVVFTRKSHTAQLFSSLGSSFDAEFGTIQKEMEERGMIIQQTAQHLATKTLLDSDNSRAGDRKNRILQMLSPEQAQYDATWKRQRRKGTCNWIRDAQNYRVWKSERKSSTICITGKLGSGKTEPNTLKAVNILGSIAVHLLQGLPDDTFVRDTLAERYNALSGVWGPDGIVDIILELAPQNRYAIVIDGLEDCLDEDIDDVILALDRLAESRVVLLCYSARSESRFQRRARTHLATDFSASLDVMEHNQEIGGHIRKEVMRRNTCGLLSNELEALVIQELTRGSHGMYLWVSLQLDEIFPAYAQVITTHERILNLIMNLPKDLPEAFERALEGITDKRYDGKLMKLVMAAVLPLTLDELRVALTITPGEPIWRPTRIPHDGDQLITLCGGNLVELDEEDNKVRFIHHSVIQHLLSTAMKPSTTPYHFSDRDAENHIGSVCVTYLNSTIFDSRVTVTRTLGGDELIGRIEGTTKQDPTAAVVNRVARYFNHRERLRPDLSGFDIGRVAAEIQALRLEVRLDPLCFESYAVDHWLFHSRFFRKDDETCHDSWPLWWRLLNGMATSRPVPFPSFKEDPVPALTWAILHGNSAVFFNILVSKEARIQDPQQIFQVIKDLDRRRSIFGAWLGDILAQVIELFLISTRNRIHLEHRWDVEIGRLYALGADPTVRHHKTKAISVQKMITYLVIENNVLDLRNEVLRALLSDQAARNLLQLRFVPMALSRLIEAGKDATLYIILDCHPNLEMDHTAASLVEVAMKSNRMAVLERLLAAGASPIESFIDGRPAIQYAFERRRKDMFEILGKYGAINACTSDGTSLLWKTIQEDRNDEWLLILLRNGADPNAGPFLDIAHNSAQIDSWLYPLQAAVQRNNTLACLRLLEYGAKACPSSGPIPFHVATEKRNEIVSAVLHDLDAKNISPGQYTEGRARYTPTALFVALRTYLEDDAESFWFRKPELYCIMQMLLNISGNKYLDARDQWGNTALHYLVLQRHTSNVLALLLEHGAYPNGVNNQGQTPLDVAYSSGADFEAIIYPLLDKGAILYDATENYDATESTSHLQSSYAANTLHHLASHHPAELLLLLDKGADPNTRDHQGMTPLHIAAMEGRSATACLRVLLKRGGDPNIRTSAGHYPLHFAIMSRYPDNAAVSALVKAGAAVHNVPHEVSLLEQAIQANCSDSDASLIVETLLHAGADPNLRVSNGGTLADFAIERRRKAIAFMLRHCIVTPIRTPPRTGDSRVKRSVGRSSGFSGRRKSELVTIIEES